MFGHKYTVNRESSENLETCLELVRKETSGLIWFIVFERNRSFCVEFYVMRSFRYQHGVGRRVERVRRLRLEIGVALIDTVRFAKFIGALASQILSARLNL